MRKRIKKKRRNLKIKKDSDKDDDKEDSDKDEKPTKESVDALKLEIFEAARNGVISELDRDALLYTLEAKYVSSINNNSFTGRIENDIDYRLKSVGLNPSKSYETEADRIAAKLDKNDKIRKMDEDAIRKRAEEFANRQIQKKEAYEAMKRNASNVALDKVKAEREKIKKNENFASKAAMDHLKYSQGQMRPSVDRYMRSLNDLKK